MCSAATSHRQRLDPASPVLANLPQSAQAFLQSVPKRVQEPAQCQGPGRDLQPCALQTADHQVGVSQMGAETDTQAATDKCAGSVMQH